MPGTPAGPERAIALPLDRPFVGRSAELGVLDAAAARAARGEPTVLIVSGEAGIGKSSLVAEFARRAERRGTLVLVGACVELSVPVPYLPLAEMLRRAARALPPERFAEIRARGGSELHLLVPELASEPTNGRAVSPELARSRLFDGLLGAFAEMGREEPVAIVVDDLQWADRSTLDLLRFLARALQDEHVLLILTCRAPEAVLPTAAREALVDIARSPRAVSLELAGLAEADVDELLTALLGRAPDAAVAADLATRTHGNPFYVERLAERPDRGSSLPPRLRDTLLTARDGLPGEALRALDVLALSRGAVPHDVLAGIVGVTPQELDGVLREPVERRLVRVQDGDYRLDHALVQEALAERLLPGETRELHRVLAEGLEAHGAIPSVRAHHWMAARVPERAYPAALEAGRAAAASAALPEAHEHLDTALDLRAQLGDAEVEPSLVDLLRETAEAAVGAGRFDAAARRFREALATAEEIPDDELALLYLRLAFVDFRLGRPEMDVWAERAAEIAMSLPPGRRRPAVLAAIGLFQKDATLARALATEALEMARASGARDVQARALVSLGMSHQGQGRYDEAIACFREAWELARDAGADEDAIRASLNLSWTLLSAGHAAEAVEVAERGFAHARAVGLERAFDSALRSNSVLALTLSGRLGEAWARGSQPILPAIDPWAAIGLLGRLAPVACWLGYEAAAREMLDRAARLARTLAPRHPLRVDIAYVEALVLLLDGDAGGALQSSLETLEAFDLDERDSVLAVAACGLRAAADLAARARALRRDDLPRLREAARTFVAAREALGAPQSKYEEALASLVAAEAARLEAPAPDAWRASVAAFDVFGQGPDAAYAAFRLAEALADSRAPADEVRAAVADALERARTLPMPRLEAELAALGRERRISTAAPVPAESSDVLAGLGLTRRQVDVLRLLSEGKTNKRIAADLVISEKTAAHHVSSILSRLGVQTRGEAAAMARRAGLGSEARD